jgi:hypothetical protein
MPGVNSVVLSDGALVTASPALSFICPTCPSGGADASSSSISFLPSPSAERIILTHSSVFNFSTQTLSKATVTFAACLVTPSLGSLPPNVVFAPSYSCVTGACASFPCQNGAVCDAVGNSYTCECLPGFKGLNW